MFRGFSPGGGTEKSFSLQNADGGKKKRIARRRDTRWIWERKEGEKDQGGLLFPSSELLRKNTSGGEKK